MAVTTMSSRDFNQDTSGAKRAAKEGPVFITCLLISPVDLKCLVLRVRRLDVTLMLGIQSGDDRTS